MSSSWTFPSLKFLLDFPITQIPPGLSHYSYMYNQIPPGHSHHSYVQSNLLLDIPITHMYNQKQQRNNVIMITSICPLPCI